jgi:hypothetical protein
MTGHHRGGSGTMSADAMMGMITDVLRDHGSDEPDIFVTPAGDGTESWTITIRYDRGARNSQVSPVEGANGRPGSWVLTDIMVDLVLGAD